jgi:hypothetical protein
VTLHILHLEKHATSSMQNCQFTDDVPVASPACRVFVRLTITMRKQRHHGAHSLVIELFWLCVGDAEAVQRGTVCWGGSKFSNFCVLLMQMKVTAQTFCFLLLPLMSHNISQSFVTIR